MDNYLQTLPKDVSGIVEKYREENEINNKIVMDIMGLISIHYVTFEERITIDKILIKNNLPFRMKENEKAIHVKATIQRIETKEGFHVGARHLTVNNCNIPLAVISVIRKDFVSDQQLIALLSEVISCKLSDSDELNKILFKHKSDILIVRIFTKEEDKYVTRHLIGYFKTDTLIVS